MMSRRMDKGEEREGSGRDQEGIKVNGEEQVLRNREVRSKSVWFSVSIPLVLPLAKTEEILWVLIEVLHIWLL